MQKKKKKNQTCVVVAKQTVTNNIYMEEVCISAASRGPACLSLHQSKDNGGSPHCNYQTMALSVTSHKYEKGGMDKGVGPKFATILDARMRKQPSIVFILSKSPERESF